MRGNFVSIAVKIASPSINVKILDGIEKLIDSFYTTEIQDIDVFYLSAHIAVTEQYRLQ